METENETVLRLSAAYQEIDVPKEKVPTTLGRIKLPFYQWMLIWLITIASPFVALVLFWWYY